MGGRLSMLALRLLLRLHPSRFRQEFGAEVLWAARRAARTGRGPGGIRVVVDAAATLARAWRDVVVERWPAAGGRRLPEALLRDAGLALRGLRRRPGQGSAIIITLAVALGANAAIYTVAHELLLDRLPYEGAERVVHVTRAPVEMMMSGGQPTWRVGPALADHPGVESAATYFPDAGANLVAGEDASRVRITHVSRDFFDVIGVRLLLGRGPRGSGEAEAVLGHRVWRDAFGGEPEVVGRTMVLSGRGFVVVGVAPPGVEFPAGTDLWLSDPPVGEFFGSAFGPSVVVRLRPGAQAAVEASLRENAEVRRAEAGEYAHYVVDPTLEPLRSSLTAGVRQPLIVLAAAAFAVLLLGCVNVAGVSMTRMLARAPELAVRRALGAGRLRLFSQLLAELTVLAALAGGLSVLLAAAAVPLLVRLLPAGTAGLDAIRADGWTLLFTGLATTVAAVLAGAPPAIAGARMGGPNTHPDRLRTDDRPRHRLQGALTSVQVALALLLVTVASLLGRSLAELRAVPLGYDTEGVLTFEVRLPRQTYSTAADMRRYAEGMRDRLLALPGVQAVGVTDRLPLAEGMRIGARVWPAAKAGEVEETAVLAAASDSYFRAMGIRLVEGRAFTSADGETEVILSRRLTRALFGDAPAVGSDIVARLPEGERTARVVGVAEDTRLRGADAEPELLLYRPLATVAVSSPAFAVRVAASPAAISPAVRRAVREVDPGVPPHALRTTGVAVAETLAARRAASLVALLFGGAALLLAVISVHTLLAQAVARRRRELGVRLALGATALRLEAGFVLRGLAWTAIGLGGGVLLSLAAGHLLEGLVFGVAPRDPRLLGGTALLVLLAALLAAWLPARRAGRIDPATSLRG